MRFTVLRTFYFSILGMALFLPIYSRLTAIFIILLTVAWFVNGHLREKIKSLFEQKLALLFMLVYIMYLPGMIAFSNEAWDPALLRLKISIFLFPLFFFVPGRLNIPSRTLILRLFVAGCTMGCIILLSVAAYHFFVEGANSFYYEDLIDPINIHPSVYSMFLVFCVLILLLPLLDNNQQAVINSRVISLLLAGFFVVIIFLLSSRQEILALLLLLPGILLYSFFKRKKFALGISLSAALVAALLLIIFLIPETKMRLQKMNSQLSESYSNESPNSVTMRKAIWESAFEIIAEHPITGVGAGAVDDELNKKYTDKNLLRPLKENMNAHNQYLQIAIATGTPGLLIFLTSLFFGLLLSIRTGDSLYAVFLLLFAICITTECMLESEAGVVFFSFFNSMLASYAQATK